MLHTLAHWKTIIEVLAAIYIPSTLIFLWCLATAAPDPYDDFYDNHYTH